MTTDWPGAWHRYRSAPAPVGGATRTALYPTAGHGGHVYAGCHSFAIPANAKDRGGAVKLLRFLTDADSQAFEARRGSVPVRTAVLEQVTAEAAAGSVEAERLAQLRTTVGEALVPPRHARFPALEDLVWRAAQRHRLRRSSPASSATSACWRAVMPGRETPYGWPTFRSMPTALRSNACSRAGCRSHGSITTTPGRFRCMPICARNSTPRRQCVRVCWWITLSQGATALGR